MLQIQPEKDIVVEFIKNEEFKYVRALGAFYLRLTGTSVDVYKYLEPLYNDNRKLRHQNRGGGYEIVHMDEFIDQLLRNDRVCDIILPRVQKRHILEENNELEAKVSALDDDLDEEGSDDEPNPDDVVREENDTKKKHKRETDRRDERKESNRRESDRRDFDRREFDRRESDRRDSDRRDSDRRRNKYDKYSRDRDYDRRYESNRRDDRNDRKRDRDRDRSDRKRHHDYDDYEYKRRH